MPPSEDAEMQSIGYSNLESKKEEVPASATMCGTNFSASFGSKQRSGLCKRAQVNVR
jgi:hypothetical protein